MSRLALLRAVTVAFVLVGCAPLVAACTREDSSTPSTVTVTTSDDDRIEELENQLEDSNEEVEDLHEQLEDATDDHKTSTTGNDSNNDNDGGGGLGDDSAARQEAVFQSQRAKALRKVRQTYRAMEKCRKTTTFRTYVDENTNQIVCGIPQVRKTYPKLGASLDLAHDAPGHLWLSGIATTSAEIDVMTAKLPDGKVVTFHMSVNHLDGHKQDCYPEHEAICAAGVW